MRKLKELRQQAGYSLQDVADAVGVTKQYIGRLENGQNEMPTARIALKIADLFKIDIRELLDPENEEE